MLCSVTNISGSKFILLFDCKGKYWYKWLPSHRCDWIKGKRDLSHISNDNRAIPPAKSCLVKRGSFSSRLSDICESQQSYFEILHCSCDIISSSFFRSTECSLFLCGFPTPSSLSTTTILRLEDLLLPCVWMFQSAPVLCWLIKGSR